MWNLWRRWPGWITGLSAVIAVWAIAGLFLLNVTFVAAGQSLRPASDVNNSGGWTRTPTGGTLASGAGVLARFKHKSDVQKWLDIIRGSYAPTAVEFLKIGTRPPFPYSDVRLLPYLQHSFWFLPNVAACHAMANLLAEKQNSVEMLGESVEQLTGLVDQLEKDLTAAFKAK